MTGRRARALLRANVAGFFDKLGQMVGLKPANPKAFGDFDLESLLGKGAMAEVYLAVRTRGPKKGERVALKRIAPALAGHPQVVEMLLAEATLSMALDHPNVVKVFEVSRRKKIDYLVMELVDGRDMAQILRRCRELKRKLPASFAVHVTRQVLAALAHAHECTGADGRPLGVVHCDVGPPNVFISRQGDIKLGDFGVARGLLKDKFGGPIAGKTPYLSPEVLEGDVTAAADLWATGVMLYELLTLERPFVGANDGEVYQAIRMGEWVPVRERRPDVPEAVAAVLARALNSNKAARFEHAMQFADALKATGLGEEQSQPAIKAVVKTLFGGTMV